MKKDGACRIRKPTKNPENDRATFGQRKEYTTIPFSVSGIPAFKLNLDWYLPGTGTYLGYRYSGTHTWQVPKTSIIASFSCSSPRRGGYLNLRSKFIMPHTGTTVAT